MYGLVEKLPTIGSEDASAACAAINACVALKMDSKRKLLELFTTKLGLEEDLEEQAPTKAGQSRMQDYINVGYLMPVDLWMQLQDPKRPPAEGLMLLCEHCHQLGLVFPSERTMAAITCFAFWKVWKDGVPIHTKQHTVELCKTNIKSYLNHYESQKATHSGHLLKKLPKRVMDLPKKMQMIFKTSPLATVDSEALRQSLSMPCRKSHASVGISSRTSAATMVLDMKLGLVHWVNLFVYGFLFVFMKNTAVVLL